MTTTAEKSVHCPTAIELRDRGAGGSRWAYLIVLLLAVLSFVDIGHWPLHGPDEFNYITAAREMVESGDWVTPHFNGAPRLVKPVFFYWVVAGAYEVFGVHVAVARLCSTGACALGVLAVWLTARYLMGSTLALLSAVIVASNVAVLQFSRAAMPDPTLWACVAFTNYAFIRLHFSQASDEQARIRPAWFSHLFFAATAIGLLTKGPIALAWCFLPLVCAILLRQWNGLRQLRWISGVAILIALVAPWTILFVARNAAGLRAQLLDPNSTQSYAYFSRPVSTLRQFLDAGPQLAGNFLVWLPPLIAAILSALGDRVLGTTVPYKPAPWRRFFVLWVVLLVVIYASFFKKSVRYMFPIAGPASILLADALDRMLTRPDHRRDNAIVLLISGLASLLPSGVVFEIIFRSHGVNTHWLWPPALVLATAGVLLTAGCANSTMQRAMPAVLAGTVFVCMGFLPQALRPLSDDGPETLAPLLQTSLSPADPLLCYRISPRVLVFEGRRTQVDLQSFPAFLKRLETAKACFICDEDWRQVPQRQRSQFHTIGQCVTFRSPMVVSPDLARNRQTALLLVRDWSK